MRYTVRGFKYEAGTPMARLQELENKVEDGELVEVKHDKWLSTNIPTMFSGVIHECSLCKAKDGEHSSILGYYCWRCGAKMDGERKER